MRLIKLVALAWALAVVTMFRDRPVRWLLGVTELAVLTPFMVVMALALGDEVQKNLLRGIQDPLSEPELQELMGPGVMGRVTRSLVAAQSRLRS